MNAPEFLHLAELTVNVFHNSMPGGVFASLVSQETPVKRVNWSMFVKIRA